MRRLVAIPVFLVALAAVASGCRHDGREMRPALPSQNGSVSTTATAHRHLRSRTISSTTEAPAAVLPGGPIEVSTTVLTVRHHRPPGP